MRPIRLEIEGLQSYEDKQVINFEKLTEHGLFGIFGNTGSGKSTIIDAITYAIYGDIVRIKGIKNDKLDDLVNVNSEMLRVEFTFEIGRDRYSIERRAKCKKGTREISSNSKKNYMKKNGNLICDNTTEIGLQIKNIIGLTMDDFTRSVVLPQGKFSEFLKLSGSDRRNMLERIFELGEYGEKLKKKINTEKNKLFDDMSSIDNQIKGKGEDVTPENLKEKKKAMKELSEELLSFDKLKKELDSKFKEIDGIKKLSEERKDLLIERSKLDEDKDKAADDELRLARAKKANPIDEVVLEFDALLKLSVEKEEDIKDLSKRLEKEEENLELQKGKVKDADDEVKEIIQKIAGTEVSVSENTKNNALTISLNKYSDAHGNKIKLQSSLKKINDDEKDLTYKVEKLQESKDEIGEKLKNFKVVDEIEIVILQNALKDLNLKDVKKLEKDIEDTNSKLGAEIEKEEMLVKLIEQDSNRLKELKLKESVKFAIRLARDLKDGKGCPVCGSIHHPKKASIEDENLSDLENEIEAIELTLEKNQKAKASLKVDIFRERMKGFEERLDGRISNDIALKAKKIKENITDLEEKRKSQLEKQKKLENEENTVKNDFDKKNLQLVKDRENLKVTTERLEEETAKFDAAKKEVKEIDISFIAGEMVDTDGVQRYIDEIKDRHDTTEELKKNLKESQEKQEKITNQKNITQENVRKIEAEKITVEGEKKHLDSSKDKIWDKVVKLLAENGFEDVAAVKMSILTPEECNSLERAIDEYSDSVKVNKVKLDEVNRKLDGKTFDIEAYEKLKQERGENENKINRGNERSGSLNGDIKRITKELDSIKDLLEERKKIDEEYDRYDTLSKLFTGNKFVEFLSTSKIRNISKLASKRLSKISNGRYFLTTNKSSEFLIVDNFNGGETRKTSTLSGGESFLVSLALALALSSQIQLKGRIQLEFFFLDEGFGTLDSMVLDRVITSLENLKSEEKMKVGIITHVEELKERIPRKLIIHPAESGVKGSTIELT